VGDNDRLDCQPMPVQNRLDVLNLISWIDNDRFARNLLSEYRAVALQHSHGKNFVNHSARL
jgi:hypothetical protein